MGLCNTPYGLQTEIAESLGVDVERVRMHYVGLNHLSWVRRLFVDGEDCTDRVVERATAPTGEEREFDPELIRALGMIPSYYLRYFYHQQQVVSRQRAGGPTRGEQVWEIEQRLLEMYRDPELCYKPASG